MGFMREFSGSFLLLCLVLVACQPAPVQRLNSVTKNGAMVASLVSQENSFSDRCLQNYGLPDSLLKSEPHQFRADCEQLRLPESVLLESLELRLVKGPAVGVCEKVTALLERIHQRTSKLSMYRERRRSMASDQFDASVTIAESELRELLRDDLLREETALVEFKPRYRQRLQLELARMQSQGLSYQLDSEDLGHRKLLLKSYLLADMEKSLQLSGVFSLPNAFFCGLKDPQRREQNFIEYRGRFRGRAFVDVLSINWFEPAKGP